MTILLGFTTHLERPAIILASDSQITGETSDTSRSGDTPKIVPILMTTGGSVLLAKAGNKTSTDRFEEIFTEKVRAVNQTNARSVAATAEDAARTLRAEIVDRLPESERMQQRLTFDASFILAYFHKDKPCLYKLDLYGCMATEEKSGVAALGCAASLARFLLVGFDTRKPKVEALLEAAICIIELCKLHDTACGGQNQVGCVFSNGEVEVYPSMYLDKCPLPLRENRNEFHVHLVKRIGRLAHKRNIDPRSSKGNL